MPPRSPLRRATSPPPPAAHGCSHLLRSIRRVRISLSLSLSLALSHSLTLPPLPPPPSSPPNFNLSSCGFYETTLSLSLPLARALSLSVPPLPHPNSSSTGLLTFIFFKKAPKTVFPPTEQLSIFFPSFWGGSVVAERSQEVAQLLMENKRSADC